MENIIQATIVAGVVLIKNNKYLLVQEKKKKAYGLWNLPAGKVEVGYTIEQTAVKEAKEESGYDVKLIRKIDIFQENETVPVKHAFLAEIIGGELNYPADEILDAKWFSYEEILQLKDSLRGPWILSSIEQVRNS